MVEDRVEMDEPLLEPKVLQMLEDRDRVVDLGMRDKIIRNMKDNIRHRRTPDVLAERFSKETVRSVADITEPVVRDSMRDRLEQANETIMRDL